MFDITPFVLSIRGSLTWTHTLLRLWLSETANESRVLAVPKFLSPGDSLSVSDPLSLRMFVLLAHPYSNFLGTFPV